MDERTTPAPDQRLIVGDESEPPARKRRRVLSALLVIVGIVGFAWFAWTLTHVGAPKPGMGGRRPATTVGVAAARSGDVPIVIEALGSVTPPATAIVRPQVSGNLIEVPFKEGQDVVKGQVLAIIDPRPFQLALDQAQGDLVRDNAQLQNARVTLERYQTLLKQDSIARQEVDTQAATVKQLLGVVLADQAAVGVAKLNLSYSRITAPISGRIGLRQADVGNYVTSGDASGIATITQVHPIDVQFTVPEDDVPRVSQRVAAGGTLAVAAMDRTRTKTLDQGVFLTLDNQVDSGTGTVKAKARFENKANTLFPNQFVNVRLLIDTMKDAVLVPASAVRHGPNGEFVYTVQPDKTAKLKLVKTGPPVGDEVSIASGLAVGEKVVTEGGDRLTDGGKITLPGDRPSGGRGERSKGRRKAAAKADAASAPSAPAAPGSIAASAAAPPAADAAPEAKSGGVQNRLARLNEELGLDDAQKAQAQAIFAAAMQQAGDDPDARRAAMRQAMAKLEPILRPDQKVKLDAMRTRATQRAAQ